MFATRTPFGLLSVPAGGGEPNQITTPDAKLGESNHQFPSILPNGRAVLFAIVNGQDGLQAQVGVVDLTTGERKTLVRGGGQAEYVAPAGSGPGHLVYAAAGGLRAVRFDPVRLEVLGDPVPVVEQVMTKTTRAAQFSVSRQGTLVYIQGLTIEGPQRSLVMVDRQGHEDPIAAAPLRGYIYPRFAPDDSRVAIDIRDQENDIWTWDRARQTLTRLTFGPWNDTYPVWTPDGRRVIFSSRREGSNKVFWQAADGSGTAERLTNGPTDHDSLSISFDGKLVLLRDSDDQSTSLGLSVLAMDGTRRTEPLLHSTFAQDNGEISPDGHWLAYQSNESGQNQIYVRSFPKIDGGRWQISTSGGTAPLWSRAGGELFYLDVTGRLTTVPVRTAPTFSAGAPTKLLDRRYYIANGRAYDATRDGKQFLMIKESDAEPTSTGATSPPITVVHNWVEELKQRVPAR